MSRASSKPRWATLIAVAAAILIWQILAAPAARADDATAAAEASNMQIIGRSDLNGFGKGGEGLALSHTNRGRCASA
jgi:hypothetical protein